jgi:hypothetical protein
LTCRAAASASPKRSSDSATRRRSSAAGEAVELALEHEVLAAGGLAVGAVLLADDADRVSARGRALRTRRGRPTRALPVSGPGEGGEDPDGRWTCRAVGAQEPEDRAGRDLEVEAVERAHVAG